MGLDLNCRLRNFGSRSLLRRMYNSQYHSSPEHRWLSRIKYKGLCGKFSASLWSLCFTYCTFLVFLTVSERFQRVLIGCAHLWHRLTCELGLPLEMVACLDALWYSYPESCISPAIMVFSYKLVIESEFSDALQVYRGQVYQHNYRGPAEGWHWS